MKKPVTWEKGKHEWYCSYRMKNGEIGESFAVLLLVKGEGLLDPNNFPVGTTKKSLLDSGLNGKKERTYTVRVIK